MPSIDHLAEQFNRIREQFRQHLNYECQKLRHKLKSKYQTELNEKCEPLQTSLTTSQQEINQLLLKKTEMKGRFDKLQNSTKGINTQNCKRPQIDREGIIDDFDLQRKAKIARTGSVSTVETFVVNNKLPIAVMLNDMETVPHSSATAAFDVTYSTEMVRKSSNGPERSTSICEFGTIDLNGASIEQQTSEEHANNSNISNELTKSANLIEMSKSAVKAFSCPEKNCNKRFSCNKSLQIHLRAHRGEKPFVCVAPDCGKCFLTKANMLRHYQGHTGDRSFACNEPNCEAKFKSKHAMDYHMRKHRDQKPYVCTALNFGKAFPKSQDLKSHMLSNTGQRRFICTEANCGKSFWKKDNLKRHKKIHADEQSFSRNQPAYD